MTPRGRGSSSRAPCASRGSHRHVAPASPRGSTARRPGCACSPKPQARDGIARRRLVVVVGHENSRRDKRKRLSRRKRGRKAWGVGPAVAGGGGTSVISRTEFKRNGIAWEGRREAKRARVRPLPAGERGAWKWGAAGAGAGRGERVVVYIRSRVISAHWISYK